MKRLSAILFSLLLVWTQLPAASVSPACVQQPSRPCCHGAVKMPCCSAQPVSNSKPVPANPVRTSAPMDLSFPALSALTSTLPEIETHLSSASSPVTAKGTPLYARHCALLL